VKKKPASKAPQRQGNPGVQRYAVLCTPPRLLKPVLLGALYGELDPRPSITRITRPPAPRASI